MDMTPDEKLGKRSAAEKTRQYMKVMFKIIVVKL